MKRAVASLLLAILVGFVPGCVSKGSPTAPSTPYKISGAVASAAGGGISGATISVIDGPNAGMSTTTDGSGNYSLTLREGGGFSVNVTANGFVGQSTGFTLTQNSPGGSKDFTLLPAQVWTVSGTGDSVFEMPLYITKVRINGAYDGLSQTFVVHINGREIVNVNIGNYWNSHGPTFEGTYTTSGGTVETKMSTGVRWTFTEVR